MCWEVWTSSIIHIHSHIHIFSMGVLGVHKLNPLIFKCRAWQRNEKCADELLYWLSIFRKKKRSRKWLLSITEVHQLVLRWTVNNSNATVEKVSNNCWHREKKYLFFHFCYLLDALIPGEEYHCGLIYNEK